LSGSDDGTVRIWDLENSECLDQLQTKTGGVWSVAWGGDDKTWLAATRSGEIWRWPFQKSKSPMRSSRRKKTYTTAKVLFVGATGVGKSALAHRLVEKKFLPTTSTRGAWVTHFKLKQTTSKRDAEREIWVWDFAGQSDYRLINQLFMNETALAVLIFNPQSDTLFTDICEWDRDLRQIADQPVKRLLVAG